VEVRERLRELPADALVVLRPRRDRRAALEDRRRRERVAPHRRGERPERRLVVAYHRSLDELVGDRLARGRLRLLGGDSVGLEALVGHGRRRTAGGRGCRLGRVLERRHGAEDVGVLAASVERPCGRRRRRDRGERRARRRPAIAARDLVAEPLAASARLHGGAAGGARDPAPGRADDQADRGAGHEHGAGQRAQRDQDLHPHLADERLEPAPRVRADQAAVRLGPGGVRVAQPEDDAGRDQDEARAQRPQAGERAPDEDGRAEPHGERRDERGGAADENVQPARELHADDAAVPVEVLDAGQERAQREQGQPDQIRAVAGPGRGAARAARGAPTRSTRRGGARAALRSSGGGASLRSRRRLGHREMVSRAGRDPLPAQGIACHRARAAGGGGSKIAHRPRRPGGRVAAPCCRLRRAIVPAPYRRGPADRADACRHARARGRETPCESCSSSSRRSSRPRSFQRRPR
jgi:hypothetical protein